MSTSGTPAIEARGLVKSFGGSVQALALAVWLFTRRDFGVRRARLSRLHLPGRCDTTV
ncbi:MAG: hypothetical protein VW450_00410 [Chloroflexota bacterium]